MSPHRIVVTKRPARPEPHIATGVKVRYALAILCALFAAYVANAARLTGARLSGDERQTCGVLIDLHRLISIPPTPAQSKAEPEKVRAIVADLNAHLSRLRERNGECSH